MREFDQETWRQTLNCTLHVRHTETKDSFCVAGKIVSRESEARGGQRLRSAAVVYPADFFFRVLFAASDVSGANGIDNVMAVPSLPD